MIGHLNTLVSGALVLGFWTVALFFLRFWRDTRDRLFLFFSLAFAVLGTNQIALALTRARSESDSHLYVVRLGAFLLLLWAIWDKNRRPPRG